MPSTSIILTAQPAAFEKNAVGPNGLSYRRIIYLGTAAVPEQEGL